MRADGRPSVLAVARATAVASFYFCVLGLRESSLHWIDRVGRADRVKLEVGHQGQGDRWPRGTGPGGQGRAASSRKGPRK